MLLKTLFSTTLNAWLIIILISLLLFFLKNNKVQALLRGFNIILALLTVATGLVGLVTQQTVVKEISDLFLVCQ